jgi:hypothetical protein
VLPHAHSEALGIPIGDLRTSVESMSRNGSGSVKMNERRPGLWWKAVRDSSAKLAGTVPGPKVALTRGRASKAMGGSAITLFLCVTFAVRATAL